MDKRLTWRRLLTSWYISLLFFGALGIVLGALVFFHVFPGKPKIGVIDIPFTAISDDSAFVITAFLDYARRRDDIKAVVVWLNSPGGGAASSEKLFLETRRLSQEKPVVLVMNDIVASGGYMMSLGATYTYTKPTTLVGSVGVILSFPGPYIPELPDEQIITSGPYKLSGGNRRHWVALGEQVKQTFIELVVSQRGEKLRLSREEVAEARIYSGLEGVRLGLVDAIGGDSEALAKAASLAGISDYDLVDVNIEVFHSFVQKFRRIFEETWEDGGAQPGGAAISTLKGWSGQPGGAVDPLDRVTNLEMLRRLFLPSGLGEGQQRALPGFPLKVNTPNIYFLYVGPAQ